MNCENCGHTLTADDKVDESHGIAMYVHVDHVYQCPECGDMRPYRGEPEQREEGMAFYVVRTSDGVFRADRPDCPECGTPMFATKSRPDAEDDGVIQFKCDPEVSPDCPAPYRTTQRELEHVHEPGEDW